MIKNSSIYSAIASYLADAKTMSSDELRSKYVPTRQSKAQAELEAQQEIINRAFANAKEVSFTYWDKLI